MSSLKSIYDILKLQATVIPKVFSHDLPIDRRFAEIEMMNEKPDGAKISLCSFTVRSEIFSFGDIDDSPIAPKISKLYRTIRGDFESAAVKHLEAIGVNRVLGESRSCLYGSWSLHREKSNVWYEASVKLNCITP